MASEVELPDLRELKLKYFNTLDFKKCGDTISLDNTSSNNKLDSYFVQEVQRALDSKNISLDNALFALSIVPNESSVGNFDKIAQDLASDISNNSNSDVVNFTDNLYGGLLPDRVIKSSSNISKDDILNNSQLQLNLFGNKVDNVRNDSYLILQNKNKVFDPLNVEKDALNLFEVTANQYCTDSSSKELYGVAATTNAQLILDKLNYNLKDVYGLRKSVIDGDSILSPDVNRTYELSKTNKVNYEDGESVSLKGNELVSSVYNMISSVEKKIIDNDIMGISDYIKTANGYIKSGSNSIKGISDGVSSLALNLLSSETTSSNSLTTPNSINRHKFTMLLINQTGSLSMQTNQYVEVEFIPDSISDNVSANFPEMTIPGRSESFISYESTANRDISFTLKLYDPMCKNPQGIINTVNMLKSMCYPDYSTTTIYPPYCYVKLGDLIYFYGVCNNVGVSWIKPVSVDVNGKQIYVYADVSLSFKQCSTKTPDIISITNSGGNE